MQQNVDNILLFQGLSTILCIDSFLFGNYNVTVIKKRRASRRNRLKDIFERSSIMNYFGMIFTFMVPGIVVGGMAATLINEAASRRRKSASKRR